MSDGKDIKKGRTGRKKKKKEIDKEKEGRD